MNVASAGKAPWVISSSEPLLAAIASHRVASIHESERSNRFPGPAARFIREIVVRKIDVD